MVNREERDQGFTRPKVLFLVPFRDSAYKIINTIFEMCSSTQKSTIENKKRFMDEFTEEDDEPHPLKSAEWNETFHGNIDDCFRIGLKFTRKSVKLFADFFAADILVASPLGLRIIIGAEGYGYLFLATLRSSPNTLFLSPARRTATSISCHPSR